MFKALGELREKDWLCLGEGSSLENSTSTVQNKISVFLVSSSGTTDSVRSTCFLCIKAALSLECSGPWSFSVQFVNWSITAVADQGPNCAVLAQNSQLAQDLQDGILNVHLNYPRGELGTSPASSSLHTYPSATRLFINKYKVPCNRRVPICIIAGERKCLDKGHWF